MDVTSDINRPAKPKGTLDVGARDAEARDISARVRQEQRRTLRYSRFVGWAKLLLPLAAGFLLLLLAGWPYLSAGILHVREMFPHLDANQIRDLRMVNPRYSGIDKEKRPFTLTADAARQNGGAGDLVALDNPKAEVQTKEGNWVVVTGKTGMYQAGSHFLDLFKDVQLFHDKGYDFQTQSARVDLDAGNAEGNESIHGTGPAGTIDGDGFRMLQKGQDIFFTGKAHLVLNASHGRDQ